MLLIPPTCLLAVCVAVCCRWFACVMVYKLVNNEWRSCEDKPVRFMRKDEESKGYKVVKVDKYSEYILHSVIKKDKKTRHTFIVETKNGKSLMISSWCKNAQLKSAAFTRHSDMSVFVWKYRDASLGYGVGFGSRETGERFFVVKDEPVIKHSGDGYGISFTVEKADHWYHVSGNEYTCTVRGITLGIV